MTIHLEEIKGRKPPNDFAMRWIFFQGQVMVG